MPISTSVKLLINFHQCLIVSETIGEAPTIILIYCPVPKQKAYVSPVHVTAQLRVSLVQTMHLR